MVCKANKYLSSVGMSQTILLYIDFNAKLFISCPSEGIISKECIKYIISEEELYFYFLSQRYTLASNHDGYLTFKSTNVITQITTNVTFKEIEKEEYEGMNNEDDSIQVLIDADQYENQGEIIHFTYDFNDSKISAIREYVDMDNWLDTSSDFSKMYSCLTWVKDAVKHKSFVTLPTKRDAISLLNFAQNNNNKLNCRGLAILLSELCLSAGLYSRYITCNMKETNTEDCHVVVIAFSKELQKWVLLDPSYCLVLYDINQVPLSLNEFRNYIIENLEMIVDERANYYNNELDFNKYVQRTGIKLYRFSSPIHISIGCDEHYPENSVELVPNIKDYIMELPKVISDPSVFWQFPPRFRRIK
ncbi:transglutaminase domain-containing protein [Lysinibacillus capsici]|uniref:transglutaminase domain-containing protein n=1 Tax=Lysinibacillus capsici TaxID=2115968 RepID=UPI002E1CA73F|nr:transglutaminase domain-containing protein [Lysinibacillus capsici]